jgi:hypothetical protein
MVPTPGRAETTGADNQDTAVQKSLLPLSANLLEDYMAGIALDLLIGKHFETSHPGRKPIQSCDNREEIQNKFSEWICCTIILVILSSNAGCFFIGFITSFLWQVYFISHLTASYPDYSFKYLNRVR